MFNDIKLDLKEYKTFRENINKSSIWILIQRDYAQIMLIHRIRCKLIKLGILPANHILRRLQSSIYGIEIGKEVSLGHGVRFVHPVGITLGGDSRIGHRVTFLGGNTVGTAKNNGYPRIGDDVTIGAGAKIIGPIEVGSQTTIGANSVVNRSAPERATLIGLPARPLKSK